MSAVFSPRRRKLSADQFERLGATGTLGADARVELLEGEMIEMAPVGSRHASAVNTLSMLLARAVGESALASTQNPLRLSDDSELQPDLMLLLPRADRYAAALPRPREVLLLVESPTPRSPTVNPARTATASGSSPGAWTASRRQPCRRLRCN